MATQAFAVCASFVLSLVGPAALAQVRSAESYRDEIHAELRRLHGVEVFRADALREAIERAEAMLYPGSFDVPIGGWRFEDPLCEGISATTESILRHLVEALERDGVFELIDRAARAQTFVDGALWPRIEDGRIVLDVDAVQGQDLAFGTGIALHFAIMDGDATRRDAMIRRLLVLKKSHDAYGSLTYLFVANGIVMGLCEEIRLALYNGSLSEAELHHLMGVLDDIELATPSRCIPIDVLLAVAKADDGSKTAEDLNQLRKLAELLVRELEEIARTHPDDRRRPEFMKDLHARDDWSIDEWIRAVRSSLPMYVVVDQMCTGMIDGTRIALALELHRMEHGVYPETLDPLAPRLGGEVPRDASSWAPFAYAVIEDDMVGGFLLRTTREPGWDFSSRRSAFDADAGLNE